MRPFPQVVLASARFRPHAWRVEDLAGKLRTALERRGEILEAYLFGSRARGDARPGSDIDILIDIDPDAPVGVWEYAGLKTYIAALFDGPVDVVEREALKLSSRL